MLLIVSIVNALALLSQSGECAGVAYYEHLEDATGSVMLQHASHGFQSVPWCAFPTVRGFDGQAVLQCYLAMSAQDDPSEQCAGVDLYTYWNYSRVQPASARNSLRDTPSITRPAAQPVL